MPASSWDRELREVDDRWRSWIDVPERRDEPIWSYSMFGGTIPMKEWKVCNYQLKRWRIFGHDVPLYVFGKSDAPENSFAWRQEREMCRRVFFSQGGTAALIETPTPISFRGRPCQCVRFSEDRVAEILGWYKRTDYEKWKAAQ